MRALVKTERLRGHVVLREVELPKPQKDDVLIRIHAASVCGSDLHAYRYDPSYSFMAVPVILGHELSGIVEEVGEGVTDVKPGDRVIVESNVSCGRCAYCLAGDHHICEHYRVRGLHLDGGFAEYICTKVYDVHRIRADLDLLRAVWTEPLVVVVHAIKDRAQIREGDYVAVFGPGPIGILAAQVIRTVGAVPVIIGLGSDEEARLPAARALGIRTVNLSKQAIGKVMGELKCGAFDCIIDCSGSTTAIETGISVLKKGGQLILVGLFSDLSALDLSTIVRREIRIVGSYACKKQNYQTALELLSSGAVEVESIMTVFSLEQFERAFEDALDKKILKPVFLME